MVSIHYVHPHTLVTLGVLSTVICDLLRVVLADGSTTAFMPCLLFGASDVSLSYIFTSSLTSPVMSVVNPARRLHIHDVSSTPNVACLAL